MCPRLWAKPPGGHCLFRFVKESKSIFYFGFSSLIIIIIFQGCALRKITRSPKVPNYEIQGAQHKAYVKKVTKVNLVTQRQMSVAWGTQAPLENSPFFWRVATLSWYKSMCSLLKSKINSELLSILQHCQVQLLNVPSQVSPRTV